jgi:hypothetical protein
VREIDGERVLVTTPTRHEGRSSGVVFDEERVAAIVTVRESKIVRTEIYGTSAEALKAVGLEE